MLQKPYNSEELDAIRIRIDELDDRIHDTLMERAELVLRIGEEKRKKGIQVVQPAREARMIRRLLKRHKGALPEIAVVRIWRELVGAVSLLQTGLKVVVAEGENQSEYWDMARDYFGSCLPMQKAGSPLSAIAAVREGKATFAVVPWPQDEDEQPWWAYLGADGPDRMQAIVRLPYGDDPGAAPGQGTRALVISRSGFDDSGEDRSFLLIHCAPEVSRGKLVSVAEDLGLKPLGLSSRRQKGEDRPACHMLEVEGYLGRDGEDLIKSFAGRLEGGTETIKIVCSGGYPVPPVFSKTVLAQESHPSAPSPVCDSDEIQDVEVSGSYPR